MMRSVIRRLLPTLVIVASAASIMDAQPKIPQATLTSAVASKDVAAGREVQLDLKVTLPPKIHVQSNKPNDPFFIPTVLTVDAPKGVAVQEIVYPASEQLKQAGLAEPLVVFGSEFTVRVRVKLGGDISAGDLTVPGRLRYQACDETQCYPPARAEATWTLHVAAQR
jgi:DsbC/DsbD-like thiol-disulfide interchange protein